MYRKVIDIVDNRFRIETLTSESNREVPRDSHLESLVFHEAVQSVGVARCLH